VHRRLGARLPSSEVDDFLDRVHAELARLIEGNENLRNQFEQRNQQVCALFVDTGRKFGPPQVAVAA